MTRGTGTQAAEVLMNPLSTGWQNYTINKANNRICANGGDLAGSSFWDGIFSDVLGADALSAVTLSGGAPVGGVCHPGTKTVYTNDAWYKDTATFAKVVYNALTGGGALTGGRDLVGNGLSNVGAFNGQTAGTGSKLLYGLPAYTMLAEGFIRGKHDAANAFPPQATAKACIQEVDYACNTLGANFFAEVKLWVTNTAAQSVQWQRISMAIMLLGHRDYNSSALAFEAPAPGATGTPTQLDNLGQADRTNYSLFTVKAGDPTAPANLTGTVYSRTSHRGSYSGTSLAAQALSPCRQGSGRTATGRCSPAPTTRSPSPPTGE